MSEELQLKNLSVYHQRIEIIQATAEQIIKDFTPFFTGDETIRFSGNAETAYPELKNQILPIVTKMMDLNFEKFLSLLYRIDVSEKKVKEISLEHPDNFEVKISELIIERELKKVLIRKFYKG